HSFLTALRDRDLSRNTIATYFRDLKTFSRWMFDKGWTEEDRWARLKRPKFVRPKFDTLSSDDKQTILADFNPNTFLGARNLAVLSVFLDTGVRLEELVNIQTQRVRLDAGYVEVYADKTDEWRITETVEICQHYLRIRAEFLEKPVKHRDRRRTQRTLQTDTAISHITCTGSRTARSRRCSCLHSMMSWSMAVWTQRRAPSAAPGGATSITVRSMEVRTKRTGSPGGVSGRPIETAFRGG
ncbi:MAG TPA: hypothetical protein VKU60_00570, partial [Chloroflexota bacterium]|nr:hypothetical protein [Chloroflexota bacterium]